MQFFFLFLLPPIIFESGFTMDPGPFFKNFGAICLFAFGGTFGEVATAAATTHTGRCVTPRDMPRVCPVQAVMSATNGPFVDCTAVSAIFVGLFVWLMGLVRLCFGLSLVEAMLFGALISATDPVTVLAIFKQLR